ncbi:MAG TPA: hypothetical protein VIM76_06465 [Candidatus Dormibacteraeota bacterium]|jgi:hypothetical protein
MTVNAIAFYAVAVLIVLAAAAAVGLPSLRLAAFAGGALVVLLAVLDVLSEQYSLAAIEVVVPGVGAGVVFLVLRREQYRGLGASTTAGSRWWLAGPVALISGSVLVVTLALVGLHWYTNTVVAGLIGFHTNLITVLFTGAPYALAIAAVLVAVTVAAGLVIGRRSGDEQTLDQLIQARREREERARRRRDDREQGRRRPAKEDL